MFKQYKLPYGYQELEPHIDALTMETHYSKHHATYTKNLNDAANKAGVSDKEITEILGNLDAIKDEALRKAIRNNGGGFYNHNLYFSTITPSGKALTGELANAINKYFGSFEAFQEKFSALALGQFGSGWAWLSVNKAGELKLSASPNQDNPIIEGTDFVPILGIDVWEHAYYLKYKNVRAEYIKEFYQVIDWNAVSNNYNAVVNK
ncbi:MAG: superoxide dismutase [Coprobacillaceae bacterium]